MSVSDSTLAILRRSQQTEVTESEVYRRIAARTKSEHDRGVLLRLSAEEASHAAIWRRYTGEDRKPRRLLVFWRVFLSVLFGFTFVFKLMERGEDRAQRAYGSIAREVPEAAKIAAEESAHENALLDMLDEERLKYVGSMVLGLNDALVELTGTLAGLTLAMQNTRLIALSGLITGISATLSMASSEFLSAKSEGRGDALKSCLYTGAAYVVTVALLILPYLLFDPAHYLYALACMIAVVVVIILVFNYYISVAKSLPFARRFGEMALISLGVAAISFGIGLLVKQWLGVDL